jgi:hypothetical protein
MTSFQSEHEARQFLLDKMFARASTEGSPLAAQEMRVLMQSEADVGPRPLPLNDESDEEFIERMGALLKRCLSNETAEDGGLYWQAAKRLSSGVHYLNWVVAEAELQAPRPTWSWTLRRVGLAVLLIVPGAFALLIAAAALWAVVWGWVEGKERLVGVVLVASFGGMGGFLFRAWGRLARE